MFVREGIAKGRSRKKSKSDIPVVCWWHQDEEKEEEVENTPTGSGVGIEILGNHVTSSSPVIAPVAALKFDSWTLTP